MLNESHYEEKSQERKAEQPRTLTLEDEGGDEGDAWLISYADMMTLVACFFILMMAFANFDQPTFKRVAKQVEKHFKGANLQVEKNENLELATKIQSISQLTEQVKVQAHEDGLEIKFSSGFLFDTGDSNLKVNAIEMLQLLSNEISRKKNDYLIEVHGHTDSLPLSKSRRYKDNWELSAARAASVVRAFVSLGFSPRILQAIGHADTFPEAMEKDKDGKMIYENMAKNRRVIIYIREVIKTEKIGLGLEFEKEKAME